MGLPQPITNPDFGVRALSAYDLEKTLVAFITQIFSDAYRLDNPKLNLAQPDTVPFDPTGRAQTLEQKVPPQVVRGRVPRSVTGEIEVDKLPDVPAIIIQAVAGTVEKDQTNVTVRILLNAYDENPNSGGYQDLTNMLEALSIALTSYGQGAIDHAYPIILPIEWKHIEAHTFPHFIAEMTTHWQLPSGRPMPDLLEGIIPAEQIAIRTQFDNFPPNPEVYTYPPIE